MTDRIPLDERQLEELLSRPTEASCRAIARMEGDVVILGAGGKMGPTLAMMIKRAAPGKTVYAVSRFSDQAVAERLSEDCIEVVTMDLLDEAHYRRLPDAPNVFHLPGMKFGATGNQHLTWAMNAYLPAMLARHYRNSRITAFSTGNVYPFTDVNGGGPTEETPADPVGEYAQSCLARERMFGYFSNLYGTPVTLIRLNYANEPRYGIIVDLTRKIIDSKPIDLTMGYVNLIWQADANNYTIQAMSLASSPPTTINVTGPETISVRELATQIGQMVGKQPQFTSQEAPTALLSNASRCFEHFGRPATSLQQMLEMIVGYVSAGGSVLDKPTKYDIRDGKF